MIAGAPGSAISGMEIIKGAVTHKRQAEDCQRQGRRKPGDAGLFFVRSISMLTPLNFPFEFSDPFESVRPDNQRLARLRA